MSVGDPSIALIYQVLVRNLRIPFASDDASFSARGVPAFFLSDASLTRFYPHYHRPTDLPSELDRRALSAAGRAAEAILYDLQRGAPIDREASDEAIAFGSRVARGVPLWLAALLLLLPLSSTLRRARPGGVVVLGIGYSASLAASLTTALILLGPVVALSPLLLGSHSRVWKLVSVLPLIATAAAAAVAARRFDGIAVDIGFWRALALATALAGLLLIRPRNRPPRGPRDR